MTGRELAVAAPISLGVWAVAAGLLLLPGARELRSVADHAAPVVSKALPPAPVPAPLPELATAIRHEDAAALAALTARLAQRGMPVSTRQVARDLAAFGRAAVALDYLARRPDGDGADTWRLRVDLLRAAGRAGEATALLEAAARGRPAVPPADLLASGYALDRFDLLVAAIGSGALPAPEPAIVLDLARRAEAAGRLDLIAMLDSAAPADWRAADPWLALRVARRAGDTTAALTAAGRLPPAERDGARAAILAAAGDRAGLRRLLLEQPGPPLSRAERLLAAGFRDDAVATLKRAAADGPAHAPAAQRLLVLLGPRPAAADRAWLRERALAAPDWLDAYIGAEAPAVALDVLRRHPQRGATDLLLRRLTLAARADQPGEANAALAALLDGRALSVVELRQVAAALPADATPTQVAALARRRLALGIGEAQDRRDLAWSAFRAGDHAGAAAVLSDHLAREPRDAAAIRLMAEVQGKLGGGVAARPWWERALAEAPAGSRAQAEILDRLGRRREALVVIAALRRDAPGDRSLAALHARLLIADGRPGAARAVLQ